jgi:hypothetical protein
MDGSTLRVKDNKVGIGQSCPICAWQTTHPQTKPIQVTYAVLAEITRNTKIDANGN